MIVAICIFALSTAALAYTFVGYPLSIAVAAKFMAHEATQSIKVRICEPPIAIIIVVHNGEKYLRQKIASCLAQAYPQEKIRVLIVLDGCTDHSLDIARSYSENSVEVLAFANRRGKAACINDAVFKCNEGILVFTDVRQSLHVEAIRALVNNFSDETVGGVSGHLVFQKEGTTGFGESLDIYWEYEKWMRRMESSVHSCIGVTGAIYAIRRECFHEIPANTILDDVLIPMNIVMAGRRVIFEKEARAFDIPSHSPAQEKLRKVRTIAGNFQLIASNLRFFSLTRNPVAIQFISHKLMRLVAPMALAGALVSNCFLLNCGAVFSILLVAQLTFYGLATLGIVSTKASRKYIVKLPMGFMLLNWFVVLGFVEFVTNRNAHLWKSGGISNGN